MKAKDIQTGAQYLTSPSADWRANSWNTKKIRVIDPTVAHRYRNRTTDEWTTSIGKIQFRTIHGVLAEVLSEAGDVLSVEVFPVAQIRGDWEECRAEQHLFAAKRRAAKLKQDADEAAKKAGVGTATAIAAQLGYTGVRADAYGTKLIVDAELFLAMANELDKQGWKYGK